VQETLAVCRHWSHAAHAAGMQNHGGATIWPHRAYGLDAPDRHRRVGDGW
jgi:hypothetical protein